jgi:hypothetical protein
VSILVHLFVAHCDWQPQLRLCREVCLEPAFEPAFGASFGAAGARPA